jgi:tetratricopeptide (TPR) repeat protein
MILFGRGLAQRVLDAEPDSSDAWKLIGQLESMRVPRAPVVARRLAQSPLDPVEDLAFARAVHALRRAALANGGDFATLVTLAGLYQSRGVLDAARDQLERLAELHPTNPTQRAVQTAAAAERARLDATLGAGAPSDSWRNQDELERAIAETLRTGHVESAARLMESAFPARDRSWEQTDRIATLWLALGAPEQARRVWQDAREVPRPALLFARLAFADFAAGRLAEARSLYQKALSEEPKLFEALYGLSVLEADTHRRDAARDAGIAASDNAPGPEARIAVERFLRTLE